MFKILVVCTGNVCRSPVAERMLARSLADDALDAFEVRSAGLDALVGEPMQPRSAVLTTSHGADPSGFVARQLGAARLADADVVLTMTRAQRSQVAEMDPTVLRRTFTVRELARAATRLAAGPLPADPAQRWSALVVAASRGRGAYAPGETVQDDVADPYRRGDEAYEQMARELVPALDALLSFGRGAAVRALPPIETPQTAAPTRLRWWRRGGEGRD